MPMYTVQNLDTREEFDVSMGYSELEEYLKENTKIRQVFRKFPGVCDPVRIGRTKTDSNFNDVLLKAKNAHWGSTIETK